jgi:hypothetical protein
MIYLDTLKDNFDDPFAALRDQGAAYGPWPRLIQIKVRSPESLEMHQSSIAVCNHGIFGLRTIPVILCLCRLRYRLMVASYFMKVDSNSRSSTHL